MSTLWCGAGRLGSDERQLYVDRPDREGYIEVGIAEIYCKDLDPGEARAMARALIIAADQADRIRAERDARFEREARCAREHGGHDVDWTTQPWACRRCGSTKVTTTTGSAGGPIAATFKDEAYWLVPGDTTMQRRRED